MNQNLVRQIEDLYISGASEDSIAKQTQQPLDFVESVVYNLNAALNEQLTNSAYSYSNYDE